MIVSHPVLFALFPVLSLYSANVREVPASALLRPAAISVACTVVVWVLLVPSLRSVRKAALIASLATTFFWTCPYFLRLPARLFGPSAAANALPWIGLWLAVLVLLAVGIASSGRDFSVLTLVLDRVGLGLGVACLLTMAPAWWEPVRTSTTAPPLRRDDAAIRRPERLPDVYLIILDAYARADDLEEHFGLDEGLAQQLAALGFTIAERSTTNYPTTLHSIPSLLNFDYIQNLTATANARSLTRLVRDNAVMRLLRRYGYKFIACESETHLTRLPNADVRIEPEPAWSIMGLEVRPSDFERALLNQTPLDPLLRASPVRSPYARHRKRILDCIASLANWADDPAPTFVFAHVMAPHEPFVFGEDGEDVSPHELPFDLGRTFEDPDLPKEAGRVGPEYARRYRAQASYVGRLVARTVATILHRSPEPPIVIVQSDHGPRGFTPDVKAARFPILNAYHLPDGGAGRVYPSITPVNSFRIVLNHYFGANLELLPDLAYDAAWADPNHFTQVSPEPGG